MSNLLTLPATTGIKIAKSLTLPLDATTQTIGILGIRGSGKTNTGVVFAEELLSAGQQTIIIDPVDVWWGLRSSEDGKQAGYPITVLGGEHSDLPLEATSGKVLAQFAVEHGASMILSTRHLSMGDQRKLVTDFAENLYDLKAKSRTPLQLILDEADAFAPQRIPSGHERLFGAIDRLVRRGRSSGIGVTLISQRAAVVNKDVLTQIECLVCHRTISPQDRKALDAWVQANDAAGNRDAFMASLSSLVTGEAWFWSPGWLNIFQRLTVRPRKTFDSSATPKMGKQPVAPKQLAPVDLESLRASMASTLEKIKADDPQLLRQRISELERAATTTPVPAPVDTEKSYGEGFAAGHAIGIKDAVGKVQAVIAQLEFNRDNLTLPDICISRNTAKPWPPAKPQDLAPKPTNAGPADSTLGKAERAILAVLAQYRSGRTKVQVALLAGYAVTGGGFNNAIGRLRNSGYAEGKDDLRITATGLQALGSYDPLPTGKALFEYWKAKVGKAERAILEVLYDEFPHSIDKRELAHKANYEATGGGFNNALGRLRTLELISGSQSLKISEQIGKA